MEFAQQQELPTLPSDVSIVSILTITCYSLLIATFKSPTGSFADIRSAEFPVPADRFFGLSAMESVGIRSQIHA